MICESIEFRDEHGQVTGAGFICGDRRSRRCQTPDCSRRAGKLCDFPTGRDSNGKPKTCDRGMCGEHAHPQTRLGADKDYCAPHHALAEKIARAVVEGIGARW